MKKDILNNLSMGKDQTENINEVVRLRYVKGDIDDASAKHLIDLTKKDYPFGIAMAINSSLKEMGNMDARYGLAGMHNSYIPFFPNISTPIEDDLSNKNKAQYRRALIQWVDSQPDIKQVTIQQVREQAVKLGGEYLNRVNTPNPITAPTHKMVDISTKKEYQIGERIWSAKEQKYGTIVGYNENGRPLIEPEK
jgi:hypothetical protein